MTDSREYSISTRLREIESALREAARGHPMSSVTGPLEDQAEKLREIIGDLETETPGTHIYDLLASYAKQDAANTEILIQLVAATVLYKLFVDEGGGRINIRFSPKDMDDMQRLFEMRGERDGLDTVVSLNPRPEAMESWMIDNDPTTATDSKPQAVPKPDKPVWAIRYFDPEHDGVHLAKMLDRNDAERRLASYTQDGVPPPTVENRFCMHPDCPSEHCNRSEVTS